MNELNLQAPLRRPSKSNVPDSDWHAIEQLTFGFTRRVRHDLGNIVGGIELMRTMEQMSGPDDPALQQAREEMGWGEASDLTAVRRMNAIASDLSWLSQTANPAAYEPARPRRLDQLLEAAITNRLSDAAAGPTPSEDDWTREAWVVELGEMLRVAVGVLSFGWSPGDGRDEGPVRPTCSRDGSAIELRFRGVADDCQAAVTCCGLTGDRGIHCMEKAANHSTAQIATCLARHIIAVHGGEVRCETDAASPAMIVTLPLSAK